MSGQLVGEVLTAAEQGLLNGLPGPSAAALLAIAEKCRADTRQGSVRFGHIQATVRLFTGRSPRTTKRAIADLNARKLAWVIERGYKSRDGELHAPVYEVANILPTHEGEKSASATKPAPPADLDGENADLAGGSASATPTDLASAISALASAKSALASATAPPPTSGAETHDGSYDGDMTGWGSRQSGTSPGQPPQSANPPPQNLNGQQPNETEPPRYCERHPDGTPDPCLACGQARKKNEAWTAEQTRQLAAEAQARRAAIDNCPRCDDNGFIDVDDAGTIVTHCDHQAAVTR